MHSVDLLVESICGNLKVLPQKYFGSLFSLIFVQSKTNFQNNQHFFPCLYHKFPSDDFSVELSCVILMSFMSLIQLKDHHWETFDINRGKNVGCSGSWFYYEHKSRKINYQSIFVVKLFSSHKLIQPKDQHCAFSNLHQPDYNLFNI